MPLPADNKPEGAFFMLKIRKKTFVLLVSYLGAALLCLGGYALAQSRVGGNYGATARDGYLHAFTEVQSAVADLDEALKKGAYATGGEMSAAVCTEVYGDCLAAQMTMSVLPFSTQELEQTSGFVNRTGDYACWLGRRAAINGGFTDEDRKTLSDLSDTASGLSETLTGLREDLAAGNVVMDDPENVLRTRTDEYRNSSTLSAALLSSESAFPEQAELKYDGQYSYREKPGGAGDIVTRDEALKTAADFLGVGQDRLVCGAVSGGERLCYYFDADVQEGECSVIVDGQTGLVRSFTSSRVPAEGTVSQEQAASDAEKFIESRGYGEVVLESAKSAGGTVNCCFVPVQAGAKCYTDLIKISVAADNGGVYSFDASKYVENHRVRTRPGNMVSAAEAAGALPRGLAAGESTLAVIASPGGEDVFCREFVCGGKNGETVKVFVNALTGRQQEIDID